MGNIFKENIDAFPYTGVREVEGYLKLSTKEFLNHYFDGTENYDQIRNLTRGNLYKVVRVIGYGDCEDAVILDDIGNEQELGAFFFEEVEKKEFPQRLERKNN